MSDRVDEIILIKEREPLTISVQRYQELRSDPTIDRPEDSIFDEEWLGEQIVEDGEIYIQDLVWNGECSRIDTDNGFLRVLAELEGSVDLVLLCESGIYGYRLHNHRVAEHEVDFHLGLPMEEEGMPLGEDDDPEEVN